MGKEAVGTICITQKNELLNLIQSAESLCECALSLSLHPSLSLSVEILEGSLRSTLSQKRLPNE